MSTFGTMIDRIESEIVRTDINANVQDAIKSAILYYESTRFWFTEGNNAADSVTAGLSNTYTYTISDEWIDIDEYTVTVSGTEYPMHERTVSWFRNINTNASTVTGIPTFYAFHNNTSWLYPAPSTNYALTIYGHRKITALDSSGNLTLTNTAVTNDWFIEAEGLIRNRAKYLIYAGVLENPERAAFYGGLDGRGKPQGLEGQELQMLLSKTRKKISTNRFEPEWL